MKNNGRNWRGGIIKKHGRYYMWDPTHPNAYKQGYVAMAVFNASKALKKPLPKKSIVHHFDGNPGNNENSNLIVCENQEYHGLLHKRRTAHLKCGNPNFIKCYICGQYDNKSNLYVWPNGRTAVHRECRRVQSMSQQA